MIEKIEVLKTDVHRREKKLLSSAYKKELIDCSRGFCVFILRVKSINK